MEAILLSVSKASATVSGFGNISSLVCGLAVVVVRRGCSAARKLQESHSRGDSSLLGKSTSEVET
jgi:hypothetical protein